MFRDSSYFINYMDGVFRGLKMSDAFSELQYKDGRDIDTGGLVDVTGEWVFSCMR